MQKCAAQVPRRCRDTAPPAPTCAQPPLPRCPSMVAGPPAFINSVCVPRAPPLRACVGIPPPFFPPGASSVIAPLKSVRSVCGMPALNHRYRGAREICPHKIPPGTRRRGTATEESATRSATGGAYSATQSVNSLSPEAQTRASAQAGSRAGGQPQAPLAPGVREWAPPALVLAAPPTQLPPEPRR